MMKIFRLFLYCVVFGLLTSINIFAQRISKAIESKESIYGQIHASYKDTPALRHLKYERSLSEINLSYKDAWQKKYGHYYRGLGFRYGEFFASTYLKDFKGLTLWGDASYSNGKEKKVKWNSILDFERLYPYIIADSVGGDFSVEEYVFDGGLAKSLSWGHIGVQVAYRAAHGFRAVDPRPRNIVSDFEMGLSYAKDVHQYTLGGEIIYNRYSQVSNVENYNEVKQSPEWLMSGLGTEFKRITLDKSDVIYTGDDVQVGITFVPNNQEGLYADLSYRYGAMQRLISDLNVAPINGYTKHSFVSKIGYLTRSEALTWGVNTKFFCEQRIGHDNVLGKSGAGEYDVVTRLELFDAKHLSMTVDLPIGHERSQGLSWSLIPTVGYDRLQLQNIYPDHLFVMNGLIPSLLGRIKWQGQRSAVLFDLNGAYEVNLSNDSRFLRGGLPSYLVGYLDHSFEYLSGNKIKTSVGAGYRYTINERYSIGFSTRYTYMRAMRNIDHHLLITRISFNY